MGNFIWSFFHPSGDNNHPMLSRVNIPALLREVSLLDWIKLARTAYNNEYLPSGWSIIEEHTTPDSLKIVVIKHSTSLVTVLSFRGTQTTQDFITDLEIAFVGNVRTLNSAKSFYQKFSQSEEAQGRNLYFVGHSLGGAIAGLMSTATGTPAVLFDPPGCIAIADKQKDPFLESNQSKILTIVGPPNLVNSWGRHLGTFCLIAKSKKIALDEQNTAFDRLALAKRTDERHTLQYFLDCTDAAAKSNQDALHFITIWPNNVQSFVAHPAAEHHYDYTKSVDKLDGSVSYTVSPQLNGDYAIDSTRSPSTA